ncbi:hypothetical protein [Marinoscillum furvescens]|nr:hypothetical protein [Marinoscillum furvescens]
MKTNHKLFYILAAVLLTLATSCVTGNDDNAVLREHEEAFAKTARVTDLKINGVAISRDSLSHWRYVMVDPGDVLTVSATLITGKGADEASLQVSEYLYSTSTPFGLSSDDDADYKLLESMSFGAGSEAVSLTITVPEQDADGEDFHSGDHINYAFWSWNDLQGYGYNDFSVEIK